MQAVKEAIEKKKREAEELKKKLLQQNSATTNDGTEGGATSKAKTPKVYVRKKDMEEERVRRYKEEQEALERERELKKRKLNGENTNKDTDAKKANGDKDDAKGDEHNEDDDDGTHMYTREEVIRRLRILGQVVTYFGETDIVRAKRLRKFETSQGELMEGQKNDFKAAIKEYDMELLKKKAMKDKDQEGDNTAENTSAADARKMNAVASGSKLNLDIPEDFLRYYLKKFVHEWEDELEQRSEEEKRSAQGKKDTGIIKTSILYLKPLLKRLKSRSLQKEILDRLHEIIDSCLAREYIKANDAYLRLAIGNSPWPMGVTMVGIHERSGREKIESSKVAHILNDETQRKYLQAVKRVMTFCQRRYPTDPSKCVL